MAEEKVTVECPACKNLVRVPKSQSRLRVKCPACQLPFMVNPSPKKSKPGEDTVAGWVNEDLESEDTGIIPPPPPPSPPPAPAAPRPRSGGLGQVGQRLHPPTPPPQPQAAKPAEKSLEDTAVLSLDDQTTPASPAAVAPPSAASSMVNEATRKREEAKAKLRAMLDRRKSSDAEAAPEPAPASPASTPQTLHGAIVDRSKWTSEFYPQDLNIAWAVPHLIVRECTPAGVHFQFDSLWMDHPGFRASMPIRCFASGHSVADELYARPMVFCDQSGGVVRSPQVATAGVGQRMGDHSPREVEAVLSKVENMAAPFDNPVPYYATMACADIYMDCNTTKRPDGGWTCNVLVPDLITALQWLQNVNGVTGPEYELLELDIARLWTESWTSLALTVRLRLASWVSFAPGESFTRYFPDGAALAKDAGLGGLVITSTRLLHRQRATTGDVALDDGSATLIVRVEDDTPVLFLRKGTESSRIGRLRVEDVNDFVDLITGSSKINLELADI